MGPPGKAPVRGPTHDGPFPTRAEEEVLRRRAEALKAELRAIEQGRLQLALRRDEADLKQEALERLERYEQKLQSELESKAGPRGWLAAKAAPPSAERWRCTPMPGA